MRPSRAALITVAISRAKPGAQRRTPAKATVEGRFPKYTVSYAVFNPADMLTCLALGPFIIQGSVSIWTHLGRQRDRSRRSQREQVRGG